MSNEDANTAIQEQPAPNVVKAAKALSVSGRSSISYEVAAGSDSEIFLRITGNTGNGAYSKEWASLRRVRALLATVPPGEITSFALREVNKSANNASFLLSVLQAEGLLRPSTKKRRCHQLVDEPTFDAAIAAWLAAGERGVALNDGKKGGQKSKRAAQQTRRSDTEHAAPPEAPEQQAADAGEGGALVSMESIPSFTAMAAPEVPVKPAPRKSKSKKPS